MSLLGTPTTSPDAARVCSVDKQILVACGGQLLVYEPGAGVSIVHLTMMDSEARDQWSPCPSVLKMSPLLSAQEPDSQSPGLPI